ncbi:MAG: hypothetical protein WD512_15100 [Candidatus Paceibacterota bacterium]
MIQIPLLIREKIEDYINFAIWKSKMLQISIEYNNKCSYKDDQMYIEGKFANIPFNYRYIYSDNRDIYIYNLNFSFKHLLLAMKMPPQVSPNY